MNRATEVAIEELKRFEITCPNCGKRSPFARCGFVQTHWYKGPSGHTEGAYYLSHDDIKDCLIICPHSCAGEDPSQSRNFAARFRDLQNIGRAERRRIFGNIMSITKMEEEGLVRIFDGYYVQYGEGNEIKSREDIMAEEDSIYDLL